MRPAVNELGVFSLSSFGGEGWGEEAVSLILRATLKYSVGSRCRGDILLAKL
jgi:hypothetical protein